MAPWCRGVLSKASQNGEHGSLQVCTPIKSAMLRVTVRRRSLSSLVRRARSAVENHDDHASPPLF